MITSAPVTIPINGKTATPESFTLSTNSILVAADGLYDLSTIIKGTLSYSDNTTADVKNPIAWSIKNPCTGVSLNGSQLTVTDEAGKDSANGSVTLTATEKDSGANKSADLEVKIARIDLTQPVGTYKVGAVKPQPRTAQVYKESGQDTKIDGTEIVISAQKTNGTTGDYLGGANTFSADDVGEWTVNISYDLKKKGGYGTVHSQSTFTVEAAENNNADIEFSNKAAKGAFAGASYSCGHLGNNYAYIAINKSPDYNNNERATLVWSIEGNSDPETYIAPAGNDYKLTIGNNEKGFILKVVMQIISNWDNSVTATYTASRSIEVVQKELVVTSPADTVKIGETHDINAEAVVSYLANPESVGENRYATRRVQIEEFIKRFVQGQNVYSTNPWKVESWVSDGTKCNVVVETQTVPGYMQGGYGSWTTIGGQKVVTVEK